MRFIFAAVGLISLASTALAGPHGYENVPYETSAAEATSAPAESYPATSAPVTSSSALPEPYGETTAPPAGYPSSKPVRIGSYPVAGNSSIPAYTPSGVGSTATSPYEPTGSAIASNVADAKKPLVGGVLAMVGLLAAI